MLVLRKGKKRKIKRERGKNIPIRVVEKDGQKSSNSKTLLIQNYILSYV